MAWFSAALSSGLFASSTAPPPVPSSISTSNFMKVSWSFLVALLAGFLLMFGLLVGAFCLNLGVPSPSSRWAFELNQKKRHMADQAASPRLLLVGGSATLFGLSAKEIEAQTGCHTINLGTHAALGT